MDNLKIALAGEMRSGKDEVGKFLVREYGFDRLAFGDGIREICGELFPLQMGYGTKPRKLLQDFGQYCVGIDKNVWVHYLFERMDPKENIVITDLRQPHEYERLLEAGFTIVRVNTLPELRKERMRKAGERIVEAQFNHVTEGHIREFEVDYELDNNGSIEDLHLQVVHMLQDITGGEA